jgi:hypothetical protein
MSLNEDHGLTAEEAAALATPDDESEKQLVDPDAEPQAAAAEPADADPEVQAAAAPAADPDPAAAPAGAEPAAAADPAPEPAPEPAAAKAEAVAAAPAPLLHVQAPEDAQAKLDKIAADKDALLDKFEAGEVTTKDYQRQLDALNDQRADIQHQVREADLARRLNDQQIQNAWVADCNKFIGAHDQYKDQARLEELDMAIRLIAAKPENRGLDNVTALGKAHNMVCAMNGWPVDGEKKDPPPAAKPVQHKVPTPAAPPNIGSLPAASMNDTTGGEFASLNALQKSGDVEAYEDAVAKLSDAQRARYFKA